MVGKNRFIINQDEMVRAMNMYFEELVSLGEQRGHARVVTVRQKGAQLQKEFIIEIEEKEYKSKG